MTIVNVKPIGSEDPEYQAALAACSDVREMQALEKQYIIDHCGGTVADNSGKLDLSNFHEPGSVSGTVSRVEKIRGVDITFTGDSMLDVEKQIGVALRAASTVGTQPRDESTGRFTSKEELNPVDAYELELKMKRGEITVQQYLNQSGELARAFDQLSRDRLGLDPESVKTSRFQNQWAQAADEFLNSSDGADYPGGDANKEMIGKLLEENGLTDSPSAETLARVYAHMKEHGLVQKNPELEALKAAEFNAATSAEEINSLARKSIGMPSRQLWSR